MCGDNKQGMIHDRKCQGIKKKKDIMEGEKNQFKWRRGACLK